jgi:thiamine kinase-like enzyme
VLTKKTRKSVQSVVKKKIHFMNLQSILSAYNLNIETSIIEPFGNGLINNTWRVETPNQVYILQRINDTVFKKPENIAANISLIANHLHRYYPDYLFVSPTKTAVGEELIFVESEGYFRMFLFVAGSHSKDVLATPEQAFEAAAQFGKFTFLLCSHPDSSGRGLGVEDLKTTIPQFHDLSLRYRQFQAALENGNKERIAKSDDMIKTCLSFSDIVHEFEHIKTNPNFKLRVTHHDTKISNVLFDKNDKGLCVIDLDTVMAGYFISDVGDMMRTYLSPVSEEETDFTKIEVRDDFYKAIVKGYFSEMKDELTDTEKQYFFYSGKFMIYMQALRFLTDYFNNDVYYGAKYPKHNFNRAKNQLVLLQKLVEKENMLSLP